MSGDGSMDRDVRAYSGLVFPRRARLCCCATWCHSLYRNNYSYQKNIRRDLTTAESSVMLILIIFAICFFQTHRVTRFFLVFQWHYYVQVAVGYFLLLE